MSKPKRKKPPARAHPAKPHGRRMPLVAVAVVLAAGIFAGVILLRGGDLRGTESPPAASPAVPAPQPAGALTANAGFDTLNGRWLRPDGGYILEILAVDPSGAIESQYLNPRPITVARAEATREGSTLKVFVELRAPGYPGSTYTLTYDPKRDELAGVYFQAALRQSFDVVFARMK